MIRFCTTWFHSLAKWAKELVANSKTEAKADRLRELQRAIDERFLDVPAEELESYGQKLNWISGAMILLRQNVKAPKGNALDKYADSPLGPGLIYAKESLRTISSSLTVDDLT